ncbi:MAG: PEP-CTERM system histidine kinase PrsK [Burkholderiaceae bacterium]|nr:PEP-CTERM system histidine kinase PrsK [Burkholderiaceae bacterium]
MRISSDVCDARVEIALNYQPTGNAFSVNAMDSRSAMFTAWSFGVVGVAHLAFALHLVGVGYGRSIRTRAALSLVGAVASTALWGACAAAGVVFHEPQLAALSSLLDVARYGLWFAFLLSIRRPAMGAASTTSALTAGALTLVGTATLVQCIEAWGGNLPWVVARLIPMTSMALAIYGLVLVEQVFRNVPLDSRWSVKPISAGLAGFFAFDLYMYSQAVIFGKVDVDSYSIRGVIHGLMTPLLFISTTRLRDWTSQLRISRTAAFHSATLLICGAYLLFISGVGYYVKFFGGDWGRALQIGVVFASLMLLILLGISGSVRAKLRFILSRNFFRYRYDYREEWLKFTQALCSQNTPQEMGRQVIQGLADLVESPGGGLWMKDATDSVYQQTARLNLDAKLEVEKSSSDLCRMLESKNTIVNIEEYRSFPGRYGSMPLPNWLQSMDQAWLVVPLIVSEKMIGFVVLQRARIPFDTNWEVYDLLKTASRQAASFLAQMVATEALLEVSKFDAFNRMSAFVVHDLKNIVTQLSLMMKNAKRLHANPEFQKDMLDTVENSLEKMRQLMVQLREGTTPAGTTFGVDLGSVINRIESVSNRRGRHLEVRCAESVVSRGHEDRIERVIGHLVHNAIDATDTKGRVWLQVDKQGDRARVVVGDTGHGMTPEFIRERLFKPFQSTKPTGMGIGAYESSQYIQELGGKISVVSVPDRGTEVTLLIPLFGGRGGSDLEVMRPK